MIKSIRHIWKCTVATLAVSGMLMPGSALAEKPTSAKSTSGDQAQLKMAVTDVALTSGGRMTGQLVDADGKAVAGAMVSLHQNNKKVAEAVSDKSGMFQVSGLKPGMYAVSGPNAMGVARVWSEGTAPPQARTGMVLVNQKEPLVRGQYGFLEPGYILLLGTSTAAVVLGAVTLDKVDDQETRVIIVSP